MAGTWRELLGTHERRILLLQERQHLKRTVHRFFHDWVLALGLGPQRVQIHRHLSQEVHRYKSEVVEVTRDVARSSQSNAFTSITE